MAALGHQQITTVLWGALASQELLGPVPGDTKGWPYHTCAHNWNTLCVILREHGRHTPS